MTKHYQVAIDYTHCGWPAKGDGNVSAAWIGYIKAETSRQAIAEAVSQLEAQHVMLKVERTSATLSGWNR